MQRHMLWSKIHRATITDANLNYEGSLSLCPELRQAADMLLGERISVVNVNNGARFDTYLIDGKPGEVCLNGAAARLGHPGDKVIIMTYCELDDKEAREHKSLKVLVDEGNKIKDVHRG